MNYLLLIFRNFDIHVIALLVHNINPVVQIFAKVLGEGKTDSCKTGFIEKESQSIVFVLPAVVAQRHQTGSEEEVFLPAWLLSPSASGSSPPAASELQLPTVGSKRGKFNFK